MNTKTVVIKQPLGLGDVFYLQKMAFKYLDKGWQVVWPLSDNILWVSEYILGPSFCSLHDNFIGKDLYYNGEFKIEKDDVLFLSPDGYRVPGMRIMNSKYELIDSSDEDWFNYFNFIRNYKKENILYYDILKLNNNSEYVFVNKMANIEIKYSDVIDNITFKYPVIEMQVIPGFTLFDWCKVIENAKEIHTVHTSINYVIDKLDIKASVYNMYQGIHHSDVQFIPFQKKPRFIPN